MAYFYALVLLALIFALLHYFTELKTKQKVTILLVLGSMIFAGYLYNVSSAKEQAKILRVTKDFANGKTLACKDKEVNASNYTLSVGTYTFIGKENTPYSGDMVSASSCE